VTDPLVADMADSAIESERAVAEREQPCEVELSDERRWSMYVQPETQCRGVLSVVSANSCRKHPADGGQGQIL